MPLNDGAIFAGFRIVRLLGSGGMGEVYLIQHPRRRSSEGSPVVVSGWFRRDVSTKPTAQVPDDMNHTDLIVTVLRIYGFHTSFRVF